MSQQTMPAVSPEAMIGAAFDVLNNVYTQVYFNKLAQLGHVPRNTEEAVAMLKVGHDLGQLSRELEQQDSLYKNAAADLLRLEGIEPAQIAHDQAQQEESIKTAAALLSDPAVYEAALLLRLAHAGQM